MAYSSTINYKIRVDNETLECSEIIEALRGNSTSVVTCQIVGAETPRPCAEYTQTAVTALTFLVLTMIIACGLGIGFKIVYDKNKSLEKIGEAPANRPPQSLLVLPSRETETFRSKASENTYVLDESTEILQTSHDLPVYLEFEKDPPGCGKGGVDGDRIMNPYYSNDREICGDYANCKPNQVPL
ncbi:uncharacterized protein LOC108672512 [Hyalella azteca]|uniref:Uncharacterized protein LOC108672512 n=1 Tax=Hyalella azteca TaxID=294128 RepID=A0A8B7NPP0_HYAAZ|nr:uncharacterized protein LOC108672512 [Hyalella azteca]